MRIGTLLGWLTTLGAVAGCDAGDRPDVPLAELEVLQGPLSGKATVHFAVRDPQSRLVNVSFYFGTAHGADRPATRAAEGEDTRGLETAPSGVWHTFLWDTQADIGLQRLESVFLAVRVQAGSADGVGDEIGPLVVDNTDLRPTYRVSGKIRRSQFPFGVMTGDCKGKFYVGLFSDPDYPPTAQPLAVLDLGDRDYSPSGALSVDYAFAEVPIGNYQIIAVLDDNNNNIVSGGYSIDEGDLTNLGGTTVQVMCSDITQDVILNYFCLPLAPP